MHRAPNRRWPLFASSGLGAALLGAALTYIGSNDPHRIGSAYPPCPFKILTGWDCPGCGGLRMTHDLLHGHIHLAVLDNAFVLMAAPALVAWLVWRRRTRATVRVIPVVVVAIGAMAAWTVVRNLPGFPLVPVVYGGG
ncbi:DUF2752 domain-containing protein [Mycobacterium sp. MYCO198283]|nr:DUF2752 domain-containing protein [Mycobacterium sp. MYCO198283]MCG5433494.1 DUF2752 domain-containing protein [Mycobacterium sp. MYCO198283]